eukprot:CAMPEP_0183738148 /NCGR_PEP_ID=MMETSP0737-20130205/53879_1 /TAXON_ID=385413 /ORGANISM="Thalassiosira miniscula, Strain CCMP1093" /LENGTH=588 /DNA_ID=CAMNT_0025972621 /DNA_START=66 /DNA_END=1832 /DNA_ORIENTATION=+
MASVYSQSDISKDGSSVRSKKSTKSLRGIFSKRITRGGSPVDNADRADTLTASRRDERESTQRRDPPAVNSIKEKEVSSFNDKGNEFFGRGEYDAALRMYSEALKLLKNNNVVITTDEGNDEYMSSSMKRVRTARCLVNVGAVHIRRDNSDGAISALELAMRQSGLVAPSDSHYHRACEVKADAMENIGLILYKQKDYEKCGVMYADSIEARRKVLELMDTKNIKKKMAKATSVERRKYHEERNGCKLELSVTLFYMALLKERQGEIYEAVDRTEEALHARREVIPNAKQDPYSLNLFSSIGRLYCHSDIQRYQEALGYFHEVHRMKCEVVGRDHLDVVPSLNSIAFIYNKLGDYKKCVMISDRAIDIATNGRGLNRETAVAYANKGDAHKNLEDYDHAVISYETALSTQEKCLDENDMTNAEVYDRLAETHILVGDYEKAIAALEESIAVKRNVLGPDNEDLALSYSKLGDYYEKNGEYAEGIQSHTRALRIFKHVRNNGNGNGNNGNNEDGNGGGDDDNASSLSSTKHIAMEHNRIASILKSSGDTNKAMEHYMASLWHSREARLPSTDPIVADTIKNVANFQKSP